MLLVYPLPKQGLFVVTFFDGIEKYGMKLSLFSRKLIKKGRDNIQKTRMEQKKTIGNLYGKGTWVECGFRQSKQELGWTDYRLTKGKDIEKWWEIINSSH